MWISDGCAVPPAPGFLLLQSGCQPAPALPSLSEGESELTKSIRTAAAVDLEEACAGWGELWLVRLINDDRRIIKWREVLSQRLCRAVGQTLHFHPKLLTFLTRRTLTDGDKSVCGSPCCRGAAGGK